MSRIRVEIHGIVQGVGFRPFLHRLARRLDLKGWARNIPAGVELELEGTGPALTDFRAALTREAPPLAVVEEVLVTPLAGSAGYTAFAIRPSAGTGGDTLICPDLAPCPACLRELADPADRRYRYPFINCTDCGPRFSIVRSLPYDRARTSMAGFVMCPACDAEYHDIESRRYHAQPDCCPVCGPRAFFLDAEGREQPGDPIALAQAALAAGQIVAVKGTGGIHLACDAANDAAVLRLRRRKNRPDKPLAVLCWDLEAVRRLCLVSDQEAVLLESPRRPIVLLQKRSPIPDPLSANDRLGVMLPYTPLHLLLADTSAGGPDTLVMTSANLTGCPVMVDNREALRGLAGVADGFLLHDRPIQNRCDDSLVGLWEGQLCFYRRSRGYAPQPVTLPWDLTGLVAMGAEQKASFAVGRGRHAFPSQHIGDLKNAETLDHYRTALDRYLTLFGVRPAAFVCDLHPDFFSTREAETRAGSLPLLRVQHHWAHMAACMADNNLEGNAFGILWDGTGLGTDGTIWGGEFLAGDYTGFERRGSIRPIPLPGGDAAAVEIGRIALALLLDAGLAPEDAPLPPAKGRAVAALLRQPALCPTASSMGRLFDGLYALITGCGRTSYEGQGPTLLEAMVRSDQPGRYYPVAFDRTEGLRVFDTRPLVRGVVADLHRGISHAAIARGILDTLCRMAVNQCAVLNREKLPVVLSGGVFFNRYLLTGITRRLRLAGFPVFTHRRVSPGDEGLCLGQLAIAAARLPRKGGQDVSCRSAEDPLH